MDEWWNWLPGWLGLAGGAYGAWRAWRTERRVGARYPSWTATAIDDVRLQVQSNLPYTARKVEVSIPRDIIDTRRGREKDPVSVARRGIIDLDLIEVYVSQSGTFEIRWRHWFLRHREELAIPLKERREFRATKWDRR